MEAEAKATVGAQFRSVAIMLLGAVAVFLLVRFRSKAVQDIVLWGTFLYAVTRGRKAWGAWCNPAGYAIFGLLVFVLIQIPFGSEPSYSFGRMIKYADMAAFFLAVPVIMSQRKRLGVLLVSVALAITALVAYDLVRLSLALGQGIMAGARAYQPYLLDHPNIMSTAAAAAVILLAYGAWSRRREPVAMMLCVLAMVLNVAYIVILRSRGSQLSLLASVAVAALVVPRTRRTRILALVILVAAAVLMPVVNSRFRDVLTMKGLVDRDKVWAHTVTLVKERPLLGYGVGEDVFMNAYHTDAAPESPHHFYHPHQYWLNLLFTHGIIGTFLHLFAWILVTWRLIRCSLDFGADRRPVAIAVLSLAVCMHVFGIFDCHTNIVLMLLYFTLPAAMAATRAETCT